MRASGVRSSWETAAVKPGAQLVVGPLLSHQIVTSPQPGQTRVRDYRRGVAKVLIIEDDNVIADAMARHLAAGGFDPLVVGRGELGLARLRFENPDVCVLGSDAARARRLEADRDGARRGDRHADRRRLRAAARSTTGCTRSRSAPTTTS